MSTQRTRIQNTIHGIKKLNQVFSFYARIAAALVLSVVLWGCILTPFVLLLVQIEP